MAEYQELMAGSAMSMEGEDPGEEDGPSGSGSGTRSVPQFLVKLYRMANNLAHSSVVKWDEDGVAFWVADIAAFSRDILPVYFKHNNYASFVRQLNMYGRYTPLTVRCAFASHPHTPCPLTCLPSDLSATRVSPQHNQQGQGHAGRGHDRALLQPQLPFWPR
jgi:hypothetical protein